MAAKISVIIPNYNHARYLPERIESVLWQTEQDIEVLLLDDCSTDNSREVIAFYAQRDPRIRVVFNEQNSGNTFSQWNKGIALATGKYIWIAESDDYANPRLLEKLCAMLETNPQVSLAYADSWHVDENGATLHQHTHDAEEFKDECWREGFIESGANFIEKQLSIGNVIPNASAVLLRRSIIQQIGPAETNFKLSGDWVYWIRVLANWEVAFLAEPLNYFRQHTQNVRSKTSRAKVLLEGAKMIKHLRRHMYLGKAFEERRVRQVLRSCFYAVLYEKMKVAKVKKVLVVLNRTLPNFLSICLKELAYTLLANRMSGIRQLLGDGLLYKVFPKT